MEKVNEANQSDGSADRQAGIRPVGMEMGVAGDDGAVPGRHTDGVPELHGDAPAHVLRGGLRTGSVHAEHAAATDMGAADRPAAAGGRSADAAAGLPLHDGEVSERAQRGAHGGLLGLAIVLRLPKARTGLLDVYIQSGLSPEEAEAKYESYANRWRLPIIAALAGLTAPPYATQRMEFHGKEGSPSRSIPGYITIQGRSATLRALNPYTCFPDARITRCSAFVARAATCQHRQQRRLGLSLRVGASTNSPPVFITL